VGGLSRGRLRSLQQREIGVGDASYERRGLLRALGFLVFVRKLLRRNEFGFWRGGDYRELDFLMQ
jgi:hypothetical protein